MEAKCPGLLQLKQIIVVSVGAGRQGSIRGVLFLAYTKGSFRAIGGGVTAVIIYIVPIFVAVYT